MGLPSGAHVRIGEYEYFLDQSYEDLTNRRNYVRTGRSIFAEQFSPTGIPGAQNLRQENMVWAITNFDGEGQVVLDPDDPESARRFYKSEGLDLRTAGQFKLNRSSIAQTPALTGAAATTYQGNANMADVVGTSTTSGTDRRLTAVNDQVQTSADYAPGISNVSVDFYLYREQFTDYATTINGSALNLDSGNGAADGTTFVLKQQSSARSTAKSTGTAFTATENQRVEFRAHIGGPATHHAEDAIFRVVDKTADKIIDVEHVSVRDSSTPTDATATLQFNPKAGHDYLFTITRKGDGQGRLVIDNIKFGVQLTENRALIEVYNGTTTTTVSTRTIHVTAQSAGHLVGSIILPAVAATNYRFRVKRTAGKQRIWVDKVVATLQSGTVWTLDCLEVGLGGVVWLAAHNAAADTRVWRYDASTDSFGSDSFATLNDGAASTDSTVRAMAHTDSREYFLLSNGDVYSVTLAAADDRFVDSSTGAVGMTVSQNRLFVLEEGSTGVIISVYALDGAGVVTASVTETIAAGVKSPNAGLRQRMCSTPTGARYFVNYGDATAKIFETDSSQTTLATRELADLGHGVTASAIAYEGGLTFIAGQYVAEADQTAQSALWIIDANGVLERIGFFRFDAPIASAPAFLVPYQQDMYILQGKYVWRYSLVRGGLTLEYELSPTTASTARALAVMQGRTFAVYNAEVWVTGSEGTYRQSGVTEGNTLTTSIYDYGLPGIKKTLVKMQLLTDTLASNTQVTVEYQTDQDGTWTMAGVAQTGAQHTFIVSSPLNPAQFNTLQVRITCASLGGVSSPIVKGLMVTATAADQEETFDLVLLCEDQDSSFHIDGSQAPGSDAADALSALWQSGVPTTFVDGMSTKIAGSAPSYLTTIETFRDERIVVGEGRVFVSLKVVK